MINAPSLIKLYLPHTNREENFTVAKMFEGVKNYFVEEREGFEPSVPLRVHFLSREARSTTPAPLLLIKSGANISINRHTKKFFAAKYAIRISSFIKIKMSFKIFCFRKFFE